MRREYKWRSLLCLCGTKSCLECGSPPTEALSDNATLQSCTTMNSPVSLSTPRSETSPPLSPTSTSQATFRVDHSFDPTEDYYLRFDRVMHHQEHEQLTISSLQRASLIEDARIILSSPYPSRNRMQQSLRKLELIIACETNIKERRDFIDEYEVYKALHDCDNVTDAEQAQVYREGAENVAYSDEQRFHAYRLAILYTNNLVAKRALFDAYVLYCQSLKLK